MAVYAKSISQEWEKAFNEFESISGFEIMYQDEIDSGESTCREVWLANQRFLGDVMADCQNIKTPDDEEVQHG